MIDLKVDNWKNLGISYFTMKDTKNYRELGIK